MHALALLLILCFLEVAKGEGRMGNGLTDVNNESEINVLNFPRAHNYLLFLLMFAVYASVRSWAVSLRVGFEVMCSIHILIIQLRERRLSGPMSVVQFRYLYTYMYLHASCSATGTWYLGDMTTRLCVTRARHSSNLSSEFQVPNLALKYPMTPETCKVTQRREWYECIPMATKVVVKRTRKIKPTVVYEYIPNRNDSKLWIGKVGWLIAAEEKKHTGVCSVSLKSRRAISRPLALGWLDG